MNRLKKFYRSFIIGDIKNTEEIPDVDEWMAFLASLPVPEDEIGEAWCKYLCRRKYIPAGKTVLFNAAAGLVLLTALPRMLKKRPALPEAPGQDSLLLLEKWKDVPYGDVWPEELSKAYGEVKVIGRSSAKYGELSPEALAIYKEVRRRYPSAFYFRLWVLRELSNHSRYIRLHNPSAAAIYLNERNIAGPVLTKLYEDTGRKLISFMHGEYLMQLIQAYMDFSEYYVWDPMYEDMFRRNLRCGIREYHVTKPLKLRKKWRLEEVEPTVYCTYYLSGESTASVRKLGEVFRKMAEDGRIVKVRPHPRFSHMDQIREHFPNDMIEDPSSVSMEESLGRTRYAAGLQTTVLSEAAAEGRPVVIDDISDPEKYRNLKKRRFIVLDREHLLLSEIV